MGEEDKDGNGRREGGEIKGRRREKVLEEEEGTNSGPDSKMQKLKNAVRFLKKQKIVWGGQRTREAQRSNLNKLAWQRFL